MTEEEPKQYLEEHVVPERRGMLGGRSLEMASGKTLLKTTMAATCEGCGLYPLERFVLCVTCRKRLCSDCSVKMNGIHYCRPHAMEILPLSRNGCKVLMCIEAGIDDVAKINDITKIPKDDVKASLTFLRERKLISSSGLFAFLERKITAEGLHAVSVFKKVYDEDDVKEVEVQLAGEKEDGN